MASYADAYGYTPEEFMLLTLPNLTHFGNYARKQSDSIESASSSRKPGFTSTGANSRQGKWKSGTSVESLIGMYGSKDAKKNLMNEMLGKEPEKK